MRGIGVRVVERNRVLHATSGFQEETLSLFSLSRARMNTCWTVNIPLHITKAQVQDEDLTWIRC